MAARCRGQPLKEIDMTTSRLVLALAAFTCAATTGLAQAVTRHGAVTGPNGASATRTVERGAGQVTATTTGPNGNSRVREVSRNASGATASVTGANGATATRSTTRDAEGSTTTVTGRRGRTGTVTVAH
jgi:hypothetical protein